jgi:hypothetical protein
MPKGERHCSGCGSDAHDIRQCPTPGTKTCGRCGGVNGCKPECSRVAAGLGRLTMDDIIAGASRPGGKEQVKQWLQHAEAELARTRDDIATLQADLAVQLTRKGFLTSLLQSAAS